MHRTRKQMSEPTEAFLAASKEGKRMNEEAHKRMPVVRDPSRDLKGMGCAAPLSILGADRCHRHALLVSL